MRLVQDLHQRFAVWMKRMNQLQVADGELIQPDKFRVIKAINAGDMAKIDPACSREDSAQWLLLRWSPPVLSQSQSLSDELVPSNWSSFSRA